MIQLNVYCVEGDRKHGGRYIQRFVTKTLEEACAAAHNDCEGLVIDRVKLDTPNVKADI